MTTKLPDPVLGMVCCCLNRVQWPFQYSLNISEVVYKGNNYIANMHNTT